MEFLIAMDLEGINGVVGEPYGKLSKDSPYYAPAVEKAEKEADTAIKALFDAGAEKVAFWDNHGGGNNLDFSKLDKRVIKIDPSGYKHRYDFVKEHNFSGVLFMGYHAREGTLGGVLAHSFNSVGIQYIKLDGHAIGELEIDAYICQSHGIPTIFFAGDDVFVRQARELLSNASCVITKYGKSRNQAILRDENTVLKEIYDGIKSAVAKNTADRPLYTCPAKLEIRYTRAEKAAEVYTRALKEYNIPVCYGEDSHILFFTVSAVNQIPNLL